MKSIYQISEGKIQLIKIDTDGFDFNLIIGNSEVIESSKPNLFFEYHISFNADDFDNSLKVISLLENNGYSFIVYDNIVNMLDHFHSDAIQKFNRLNKYLYNSKMQGGGIYYLDVFTTSNLLIYQQLVQKDIEVDHFN